MRRLKMNSITFKEWLSLDDEKRKKIQESWQTNKGEGHYIAKEAAKLFEDKYGGLENISKIRQGICHGGDWVIGAILRVGHSLELPDEFLGFKVRKTFWGLSDGLKDKLKNNYKNDISKFIEGEIESFRKCFTFIKMPLDERARVYLIDFVNNKRPDATNERDLPAI
jgi:hypothetical protein